MNGARAAAFDFVTSRIHPGWSVLDIGAGSSPLAGMLSERGCKVVAMDRDFAAMDRVRGLVAGKYTILVDDAINGIYGRSDYDACVAVYSLQHMIPFEPLVWVKIRHALKTGGRFLYVGRYQSDAPRLEADRDDPLIGGNELTVNALAVLSGFVLTEFVKYRYETDSFQRGEAGANAFGAGLVAV